MMTYAIKRLLLMIPTLLGVATLIFFMLRVVPGDIVEIRLRGDSGSVSQEGSTLTFGSKMFTWKTLDAAAGDYAVGFVVEDLDGNQQEALTRITVR